MSALLPTLDLFGAPTPPPQIVRLDRSTDRERPCCDNLATIHPRPDGPHAAELRCAGCGKHRGWLPRVALDFLAATTMPSARRLNPSRFVNQPSETITCKSSNATSREFCSKHRQGDRRAARLPKATATVAGVE